MVGNCGKAVCKFHGLLKLKSDIKKLNVMSRCL